MSEVISFHPPRDGQPQIKPNAFFPLILLLFRFKGKPLCPKFGIEKKVQLQYKKNWSHRKRLVLGIDLYYTISDQGCIWTTNVFCGRDCIWPINTYNIWPRLYLTNKYIFWLRLYLTHKYNLWLVDVCSGNWEKWNKHWSLTLLRDLLLLNLKKKTAFLSEMF